jgi:hypothetical protein
MPSRVRIIATRTLLSWLYLETARVTDRNRYSDLLRAGRFGDRIPEGERFSAPVQTGSEAHPASYTKGYRLFPG